MCILSILPVFISAVSIAFAAISADVIAHAAICAVPIVPVTEPAATDPIIALVILPFVDIFAPSISPLLIAIFAKAISPVPIAIFAMSMAPDPILIFATSIAPVALISAFVILFATIFAAVIELAATWSPFTESF